MSTFETDKPSPKIVDDCVLEILLHLINDHYTLYNCIQVNRTWCQLAIPLLWKDPFKSKKPKIIQTLIRNFDVQSKSQLLKRRAFNSSYSSSSTLYNYSSFVQHFDFSSFKLSIMKWLNKTLNRTPKYDEMIFIYKLVGNHVFKNTRGFITLSIDYNYKKITNDFECFGDHGEIFDDEITSNFSELYNISDFENFGNAITNIESFTYSYEGFEPINHQKDFLVAITEIFKKLTLHSNKIQNLSIHSIIEDEYVEHICLIRRLISKIIRNQQNLQSISFLEEWRDPDGFDPFFTSLTEYQRTSNSLKSLKFTYFSDIGGLLPFLASCHSLETLEFTNFFCDYDVLEFCASHVNKLAPIHIKNLKFYQTRFGLIRYDKNNYIKAVETLLRLSSKSLQTITIENVENKIIRSILDYCNSLTYLSIKIQSKYFPKFVDILPSLSNLKHLILVRGNKRIVKEATTSMQSFAKSFPSSLRRLGLDMTTINTKILELFFDEMEVPITTLDLYTTMEFGYLEVIHKYIKFKNSNLKNLGFNSFIDNSLNNNRSLLNYTKIMSDIYNLGISVYIVENHLHNQVD